jgi:hypothetical protein
MVIPTLSERSGKSELTISQSHIAGDAHNGDMSRQGKSYPPPMSVGLNAVSVVPDATPGYLARFNWSNLLIECLAHR